MAHLESWAVFLDLILIGFDISVVSSCELFRPVFTAGFEDVWLHFTLLESCTYGPDFPSFGFPDSLVSSPEVHSESVSSLDVSLHAEEICLFLTLLESIEEDILCLLEFG